MEENKLPQSDESKEFVLQLNSEQKAVIERARKDYLSGNYFTTDEVFGELLDKTE